MGETAAKASMGASTLDWLLAHVALPPWLTLLIVGIVLAGRIGFAGYVLAKAGRSPLWSLVLLVPLAEVLAVWVFAYARWPRMEAGRQP